MLLQNENLLLTTFYQNGNHLSNTVQITQHVCYYWIPCVYAVDMKLHGAAG